MTWRRASQPSLPTAASTAGGFIPGTRNRINSGGVTLTRYLDLNGLTPTSTAEEALNYAVALGLTWDTFGIDYAALSAGDVVVTGPWIDYSWLPPHVGIEVWPDHTAPVHREEALVVALRERGCPVGLRLEPPKTARSQYWTRYHEALAWVRDVAGLVPPSSTVSIQRAVAPHSVIEDVDSALDLISSLHGGAFGFDFETNSLDVRAVTRYGFSLSNAEHAWWVPDVVAMDKRVLTAVTALLLDHHSQPRMSNSKYDLSVLWALTGIEPTQCAPVWDTQPMHWLLYAHQPVHGLKHITKQLLGRDVLELDDLGGPDEFWNQPLATQALYAAAGDARNSYDLVGLLTDGLRDADLLDLYVRIEQPATPVLAEMELAGLSIDRDVLASLADEFQAWSADITRELATLGFKGSATNDHHIRRWLYDELGLPKLAVTDKMKWGKVDVDTLRRLYLRKSYDPAVAKHARAVELLIDFSEVDKALSTFIMPPYSSGISTLYPDWLQTSVVTGRLSSRPNAQNIPAHGRRGRIRQMYVAPPGKELTDVDYAQIEPRLAAHYSQDPVLLHAFRSGADVYADLGRRMGFPDSELTKHSPRRQNMKTTLLAWLYETSPMMIQAIALREGRWLELSEARTLSDGLTDTLTRFVAWRNGYVRTAAVRAEAREPLFNRRKVAWGLSAVDPSKRASARREVVNFPEQAGAGGLIKGAKPGVQKLYKQAGGRLTAQVHDELLGYTDVLTEQQRAEFNAELKAAMLWYPELSVPLDVEIGVGPSWATAKG